MNYRLECLECGESYKSTFKSQVCRKCLSILEIVYEGRLSNFGISGRSFWDFERVLPKGNYKHYIVGGTRLVRSDIAENLFLKLEQENQTQSFKDRGSVIEIAKAKEYGYDEIVCASTGNMAYSLAYYSGISGIRATIFMGSHSNPGKVRKIRAAGGALHIGRGDFTEAENIAKAYAAEHNAFLAGDYGYRKEGEKTVAYEIMGQLPRTTHIAVPVGNATLISGIFKGLLEMRRAEIIRKLPMLIAVQAKGCDSLVEASLRKSHEILYMHPTTKADAIAVGFPKFGYQAIEAIEETSGTAVAVTDAELQKWQRKLYTEYGLTAELGGVASLAGLDKIKLKRGDTAVAVISGANV